MGVTDIKIGRLFIRYYSAKGSNFSIARKRSTVEMWLHHLLIQVSWLHSKQCECDECVWERYMGITDPE